MSPVNEKKPSLRISHIAYGRQGVGNRVKYLVDPKGQGDELKIPEKLVLKRWRQRTFDGYVFKGAKLSSTLWRAWFVAFGRTDVAKLSETQIKEKITATKDERDARHLKLPEAGAVLALAEHCGKQRIMTLLARHNAESHQGKSGAPDLFLYAVHNATSRTSIARFVEVKKPDEPVRDEQKIELSLLNDLGFHARVFRLIER
jgi:hypothetical protein